MVCEQQQPGVSLNPEGNHQRFAPVAALAHGYIILLGVVSITPGVGMSILFSLQLKCAGDFFSLSSSLSVNHLSANHLC